MSYRARLLAWFVAISLLSTLVAALTITSRLGAQMAGDLTGLGRAATTALAAQAEDTLRDAAGEWVELLAMERAPAAVHQALGQLLPAHREVACAAVVGQGQLIQAAAGPCSTSLLEYAWAGQFLDTGNLQVGTAIGGGRGHLIPVWVRLPPDAGAPGTRLFLLLDLDRAMHDRQLLGDSSPYHSLALVLDRNGALLARSDHMRPQTAAYADFQVKLRDDRRLRVGDLLSEPIREGELTLDGQDYVFTAVPRPQLGWLVVIATPASVVSRLFRAAFGPVFLTLAVTLLASVSIWWWVAHSLTRGIAPMAQAADRLARADFSHPVPVPASTELALVARAMERMRERLAEYKLALLRTLMNALEARDEYTRGHSERVTIYAEAIGRRLRLGDGELQTLQVGAILHDLGKLGLDAALLRKPGRLTAREWREIQRHPVVGEQILQPLEPLRNVLPIVRSHHERLDGSGYPDGLSGEQIPLLARIVAVADCFDAMTSHRPYRPALSRAAAVAELRDMAGRHLDPAVVQALVDVLDSVPLSDDSSSSTSAPT